MKNLSLVLLFLLISITGVAQQESIQITESTIIKNPAGEQISLDAFIKLAETKEWTIEPKVDAEGKPYIQLVKLSPSQMETMVAMQTQTKSFNGNNVPYFNLVDRDGNIISSDTTRGKVVVFNFWFASCPPCIAELPELNEVFEKYKNNKDVVFAAVTFEKEEKIKQFLTKYKLEYPIVGQEGTFSQTMTRGAYPTNIIIGRDGKVEAYISGGMSGIGGQIETALRNAL